MQKLREIIEANSRWSALGIFIDRIEASRENDFSNAFENAKSLLETVCKEICQSCGQELTGQVGMNKIVKASFLALNLNDNKIALQISSSLANIGQIIGDLRNDIGITAHGKTLEEVRQRNLKIDELTKDFLFDSIKTIIIFLIRSFEYKQNTNIKIYKEDKFSERNENFDDIWDELYGEFSMGEYSYPASQILFYVDNEAYQYERKIFEMEEKEQI